ncbi:TIGR01777 family oxidoreductase [Orrella sp. 11846]|uniref:TIGR01777 family oxidoreductase n=1 Tax=Orrella sp. 11846 TaxID=3409913 RepID=UPI003B590372
MRILLTGGTGLIGQALCKHWAAQRHELWVWSRTPEQVAALCSGAKGISQLDEIDPSIQLDAVINLAGAPIADRPWTASRRQQLWTSRVDLTRDLVNWMRQSATPPRVLLSGSAIGIYGDCGEDLLTENSTPSKTDFGSQLCVAWEEEAQAAKQLGVRVILLRTAPVLTAQGGMLKKLLFPYRLGLGGRLGNGQQWMPWIHLDDQVSLIDHLLHNDQAHGPFNACAPQPVRNIDFVKTLGKTLHRPTFFATPALLLRLILGEMSVLLLGSQRLIPKRTEEAGFVWQHPNLDEALKHLLRKA